MARVSNAQQLSFPTVGSAGESPAEQLAAVAQEARGCRACPLWEIGTQTVFGEGAVPATLLVIGEAPGRQEDQQGRDSNMGCGTSSPSRGRRRHCSRRRRASRLPL